MIERDNSRGDQDQGNAVAAKSSLTVASLTEAIQFKALPWTEDDVAARLVIPRATYKEMAAQKNFPDGVKLTARPSRNRRVMVRDRPNGYQIVTARWPEDGLETSRFPIIGCTLRGTAEFRFSNYSLVCEEGRFVLIDSGIPHQDGSRPHIETGAPEDRSCDILWFYPMGEFFKCWICRSENNKHTSLPSIFLKRKNLCLLCDAIFEEFADRSAIRSKIRQGLLIALMSSVQNEIQEGRFFRWLPEAQANTSEEEVDPVKRATAYIRQHIGEPLTLEIVARYCYMSRSQFSRLFHAQTGETFNQFVTRCRVEEAKLRLTTTAAHVSGIARHVGLKPRFFNELIRRHTGMTPGDYRRQHWDEKNSW